MSIDLELRMTAYRKYLCPACHHRSGVDILYGYPTDEAFRQAEQGMVALGGCTQLPDAPERQCTRCSHQWRIQRRKPSRDQRLEQPPSYFRLEIVGWPDPGQFVEWDGCALWTGWLPDGRECIGRVTSSHWARTWSALQEAGCDPWIWKRSYIDDGVLDGTSWALTIEQAGFRCAIYGANAYPGCPDSMLDATSPFALLLKRLRRLSGNKELY